jgi:crossover junction endodeoxyribonuclease RusA
MIIMDLPYPPSANTYWRVGRGHHYISPNGLAFRAAVCTAAKLYGLQAPDGRLLLSVKLYPPDKRKRDVDNICKALLDSLTHAEIIKDDSLIDKLIIERDIIIKGGKCRIYLSEYKPDTDII